MKYGILLFSLLLFGCDSSVDQSELDELRKALDTLTLDSEQYGEDYARQIADYDRHTQITEDQLNKSQEQLDRYEKLLDRWEKQADRQDKILNAQEKNL